MRPPSSPRYRASYNPPKMLGIVTEWQSTEEVVIVATLELDKLEKVLAQHRGRDEVLKLRHMFQRLSFLHMRGNANLLVHHVPAGEVVDATVDGID